jgi:hypothetical protein
MRVELGQYGWHQVDTVLIPYGPGSIRVELGLYGFNSAWTRFEIRLCVTVTEITTNIAHFHPDQIRIVTMNDMWYATRVDAVLRCRLKRVDVVPDIYTELKFLQKNLNMTQSVFSPYRSHGILRN